MSDSNVTFEWDVFLSHNFRQKEWVRKISNQWRELGLRVFFDEEEIEPGEPIPQGVERGISGSQHIVLILSPEAVDSPWVALEVSAAIYFTLSASGSQPVRRIIPVELVQTDRESLNLLIRQNRAIDLTNDHTRKTNYHRLLKFLGIKACDLRDPPDWESASPSVVESSEDDNMENVDVQLSIGLQELSNSKRDSLRAVVAKFLELPFSRVTIVAEKRGSVIVTLKVPTRDVERLRQALDEPSSSLNKDLCQFGLQRPLPSKKTSIEFDPMAIVRKYGELYYSTFEFQSTHAVVPGCFFKVPAFDEALPTTGFNGSYIVLDFQGPDHADILSSNVVSKDGDVLSAFVFVNPDLLKYPKEFQKLVLAHEWIDVIYAFETGGKNRQSLGSQNKIDTALMFNTLSRRNLWQDTSEQLSLIHSALRELLVPKKILEEVVEDFFVNRGGLKNLKDLVFSADGELLPESESAENLRLLSEVYAHKWAVQPALVKDRIRELLGS